LVHYSVNDKQTALEYCILSVVMIFCVLPGWRWHIIPGCIVAEHNLSHDHHHGHESTNAETCFDIELKDLEVVGSHDSPRTQDGSVFAVAPRQGSLLDSGSSASLRRPTGSIISHRRLSLVGFRELEDVRSVRSGD